MPEILKILENKTTTILKSPEEPNPLKYSDFIIAACNYVNPQRGCTLSEQRARFKIMDACEVADGQIELTSSLMPVFKLVMSEFPFGIAHIDLDTLGKEIEKL